MTRLLDHARVLDTRYDENGTRMHVLVDEELQAAVAEFVLAPAV